MKIQSIDINYYYAGSLECMTDNAFHEKSLPYLSLVQSTEGSYKIKIDSSKEYETGQMGVFIAPAHKMQYITHCLNPKTQRMKAHWIFLDVIINKTYHFDDLFSPPVILPTQYQNDICNIINDIKSNDNIVDNYMSIFRLIKILFAISNVTEILNDDIFMITEYIKNNYQQKISIESLATNFNMSVPTLFRRFNKHLNCTPLEYMNAVRLTHAASLLETSNLSVRDIADAVGIPDQFYLSKLFKTKYGISPTYYKSRSISQKDG